MATLASAEEAVEALTAARLFTITPKVKLAFKQKLSLFLYRPGEKD